MSEGHDFVRHAADGIQWIHRPGEKLRHATAAYASRLSLAFPATLPPNRSFEIPGEGGAGGRLKRIDVQAAQAAAMEPSVPSEMQAAATCQDATSEMQAVAMETAAATPVLTKTRAAPADIARPAEAKADTLAMAPRSPLRTAPRDYGESVSPGPMTLRKKPLPTPAPPLPPPPTPTAGSRQGPQR